jgi:hypothetical protein
MIIRPKLTKAEWKEMATLKKAINDMPSAVSTEKMERFTKLFVMSLQGADDSHPSDRAT